MEDTGVFTYCIFMHIRSWIFMDGKRVEMLLGYLCRFLRIKISKASDGWKHPLSTCLLAATHRLYVKRVRVHD